MQAIERILERAAGVLLFFGGLATIVMMLHITGDVIGKMVFNSPIIGTLEFVAVIYMVATIYLSLAHVQAGRSHIIVELFTQRMSDRGKLKLDTVCGLLTAIYLGLMAWMGAMSAWQKTLIGETQDATFFEVPVWPSRWVLVVGTAFAALLAIVQVLRDAGRIGRGDAPARLGDHPI